MNSTEDKEPNRKMSKSSVEKTMEILFNSEKVADQISVNKMEIIALDKRRQDTRVAIREIEKSPEKKFWITIGSLLIKVKREKALELLKKDQMQIDVEINKLRSEQKLLVNKHRDLEHSSPFSGTTLKPLNPKEMSAIRSNLPLLG